MAFYGQNNEFISLGLLDNKQNDLTQVANIFSLMEKKHWESAVINSLGA